MGTSILISIALIALAVVAIAAAVDRAGQRSSREKLMELQREAEESQRKIEAEARREERAASFYALQATLQTVQAQAEMQGRSTADATAALAKVAGAMTDVERSALDVLQARATVDAYTQMLLAGQSRQARLPEFSQVERPWLKKGGLDG